jgi:hypothetical protein
MADVDLQDQVYNFLKDCFLCWLEALSLLQLVCDGIIALDSLECLVTNVSMMVEPRIESMLKRNDAGHSQQRAKEIRP